MSPTPNDATGAAHDEAPQTAPAPVDDKTLSITVGAFVVFIATWIGSKMAGTALPSAGFGGTDLRLAQIVLVLIAGVAAVLLGRSLKSIPRSVFLVITVFYFAFAALAAVFTGQFTSVEVESRLFAIVRLVHFIADLIYPLIVAQVLAVTVSRVGAALGDAQTRDASSSVWPAAAKPPRSSSSPWSPSSSSCGFCASRSRLNHCCRSPVMLSAPLPQPSALSPRSMLSARSRSPAHCRQSSRPWDATSASPALTWRTPSPSSRSSRASISAASTPSSPSTSATGLGGGYPFGPVGLLVFTIGSFGLAVITFDAVTQRRKTPADPK